MDRSRQGGYIDAMALASERHDRPYAASDPAYNGRFLTGVLTTGIYCLPSCRARKPKPENVRFFDNQEAAVEAGLRPCKRCRPDDFYGRRDPDQEIVERVAERSRRNPSAFRRRRRARTRFGARRLEARRAGPAPLPYDPRADPRTRPREGRAAAAADDRPHDRRRRVRGGVRRAVDLQRELPPAGGDDPRRVPAAARGAGFEIALPASYSTAHALEYLGRDGRSLTMRVQGRTLATGVRLGGAPAVLRAEIGGGSVVRASRPRVPLPADAAARAHSLSPPPARPPSRPGTVRAPDGGRPRARAADPGAKGDAHPPGPGPFDALAWVIVGQQITLGVRLHPARAPGAAGRRAGGERALCSPHRRSGGQPGDRGAARGTVLAAQGRVPDRRRRPSRGRRAGARPSGSGLGRAHGDGAARRAAGSAPGRRTT